MPSPALILQPHLPAPGYAKIKGMKTTLTGKNQVTVPAVIASKLKLEPGTRFEWSIGDASNTILIHIQPSRQAMLAKLREIGISHHRSPPNKNSYLQPHQ